MILSGKLMIVDKNKGLFGVIISISCGVVTIQGLLSAFIGEVFYIGNCGLSYGIVVNLYRNQLMNILIGALLLYPKDRVTHGKKVAGISKLASIVLGDCSIGCILDPLGNYLLNASRVDANYSWVIESPSPGIIARESVFEPFETGLLAIDSMVPIGRGQRELVVGDRQTGKTSIAVDSVLNQKNEPLLCVYVAIGQKAASVLEIYLALVRRDATYYLSMVVASASSSAVYQFLCAYTATALSEFYMLVGQIASFVIFDDLSRHAVSYREIYLLLQRPPGREAYPGEIFFVHSRLLERSAKLTVILGGGSVTSFPVIETLAGDVSAYITTNVISITDGQIFLSIDLFLAGIKPSIDVGLSVTRVGSVAQWDGMKLVSGSYKLELAQYIELQSFSQFTADLGEETKKRLARGRRLVELLKQFSGSPICLARQVSVLSLANKDIMKVLGIESVRTFLNLYVRIPLWVILFIAPRILAQCLVSIIHSA